MFRRNSISMLTALLVLQLINGVTSYLITTPATLSHVRPTAYPGIGVGQDDLFGRLPGHQLFRRDADCDQSHIFFCPTGTCFTDSTGLIGCCTVSSCRPRTTCIAYTSSITSPCDVNTGGCTYCSDSASPSCHVITNVEASQWIHYCDVSTTFEVLTYQNLISGGSMYSAQATSTSTGTSTKTSSTSTLSSSTTNSATSSSSSSTSSTLTSQSSSNATATGSDIASSTTSSASPPPTPPSHSVTPSDGDTVGIVIGAVGVGALAFAALWYTRRRGWLCFAPREWNGSDPAQPSHSDANEKPTNPSPFSSPDLGEDNATSANGSPPFHDEGFYAPSHIARHPELSSSPTVRGHKPTKSHDSEATLYAPLGDPDFISHSSTSERHRPPPALKPLMTERFPSNNISELPSPRTPPGNISGRGSPADSSPRAYRYTAYSPPVPGAKPPEPPQELPAGSMGQAGEEETAGPSTGTPWVYLSPEDAVKGGWRNEEGTTRQAGA